MFSKKKVIIIGSGIGGLAAALKLSSQGFEVDVYEKNLLPGGKIRCAQSPLGPIDMGPTVLTLKPKLDSLFNDVGESLEDYINIARQDILARHWWPDGSTLDLQTSLEASLVAIRDFSGRKSALEFEKFYRTTKSLFDVLESPIMNSPQVNVFELFAVAFKNFKSLAKFIINFNSLWGYLCAEFTDPRLRQLFARYATYVGSSPFQSPALLSLIWQAEARGIWTISGGMSQLPIALEQIAKRNGATFHYDSEVKKIEVNRGIVSGIINSSEEFKPADIILFNGDPAAINKGLLGSDVIKSIKKNSVSDRSLSAFVWSFLSNAKGKDLSFHNVFFNTNYRSEFLEISKGHIPTKPSIYVCAQDRALSSKKMSKERFEIIVNAAPVSGNSNRFNKIEIYERCKEITFETLRKRGLVFSSNPAKECLITPDEFGEIFPGSEGSLYGLSSSKKSSTFRRPGVKTNVQGLYLAGGGVHPGPGVPMALSPGKHAAEIILRDNLNYTSNQ